MEQFFSGTINLGNILTIIAFLIGGISFAYTIKGQVDSITIRLVSLEEQIKQIVSILVLQGRHEERMTAIDNRVLAQGSRLDEVTKRLNNVKDTLDGNHKKDSK